MELHEQVKQKRLAEGISLRSLGERLNCGYTSIGRFERDGVAGEHILYKVKVWLRLEEHIDPCKCFRCRDFVDMHTRKCNEIWENLQGRVENLIKERLEEYDAAQRERAALQRSTMPIGTFRGGY